MSRDYVYYYKKHFVHETIMMFNEFKKRCRRKKDKPYYVLEKQSDNMSKYCIGMS
ncbi:MAG: hypothetical protein U9N10_01750 [Bacillota bacterium]|nr:hypothetical protein [Bacillota bacterium]